MLQLHNAHADILIPDGLEQQAALSRTTHLGISAHQDDLEILAFHGILQCFGISDKWFSGVVCTDGAGSPRAGIYADYSDADMQKIRLAEQHTAARVGQYAAMIQLGYPSKIIKDPLDSWVEADLVQILQATTPQVIYTHNPADKHATHVGVLVKVLRAIRALPPNQRPQTVYGCEVWRDLDWMPDERKVVLDVSGRDNLAAALVGVYDSQIAGGKRYDLATLARRRANATYLESHATDVMESAIYAIDLTPVIQDDTRDIIEFVSALIEKFRAAVTQQLRQVSVPEK
ncbi:LmbE family protein [Candidatus Vecturithrix granuli]|uniref:LmbE family protein n=1 Tax=Vecturithrix granuli TaxID=1499967 RepID=A0A0S6WC05_VECG1|nr:LmbE family protein [Candidatus Vecturithrix granuli]